MRLIDADALADNIAVLFERNQALIDEWLMYQVEDAIDEAPTIDAEPVRHGHWKIKAINTFELAYGTTGYEPVYQCSECGGVEESYLRLDEPIMPEDADFPRYCPNCGAKMDEVEQ